MRNTPYDHKIHESLLKSVAPSFRQVPANAFGDSGSNQHWFECDVADIDAAALDKKLGQLGIHAGIDTAYPGRSCRKLCKYERDASFNKDMDHSAQVDAEPLTLQPDIAPIFTTSRPRG
jgi:hypothetical protein